MSDSSAPLFPALSAIDTSFVGGQIDYANLLKGWAGPSGRGMTSRVLGGAMSGGMGRTYPGGWTADRREQVRHFQHWVFVAVNTIANNIAKLSPNIAFVHNDEQGGGTGSRVQKELLHYSRRKRQEKSLHVIKPHEEVQPISAAHPLAKLFARPNDYDTAFDLWYELLLFLELTGNAYLWVAPSAWGNRPGGRGEAGELMVLPSHWVRPKWGKNGLEYYELWPYLSGSLLRFPPSEVIHFKRKSPIQKIDGFSTLEAGSELIDAYESVNLCTYFSFKNGCFPVGHMELSPAYGDLDDADLEREYAKLFSRFQGETRYGLPLITSAGVKFTPLQINPVEMAFRESRQDLRDATLALWGMSAASAGFVDRDVATYGTDKQLAENVLSPRLRYIGQVLTLHLANRWDDRLRIWWDNPVTDSQDDTIKEMEFLTRSMSASINEVRAAFGYPSWMHGDDPLSQHTGLPVPLATGKPVPPELLAATQPGGGAPGLPGMLQGESAPGEGASAPPSAIPGQEGKPAAGGGEEGAPDEGMTSLAALLGEGGTGDPTLALPPADPEKQVAKSWLSRVLKNPNEWEPHQGPHGGHYWLRRGQVDAPPNRLYQTANPGGTEQAHQSPEQNAERVRQSNNAFWAGVKGDPDRAKEVLGKLEAAMERVLPGSTDPSKAQAGRTAESLSAADKHLLGAMTQARSTIQGWLDKKPAAPAAPAVPPQSAPAAPVATPPAPAAEPAKPAAVPAPPVAEAPEPQPAPAPAQEAPKPDVAPAPSMPPPQPEAATPAPAAPGSIAERIQQATDDRARNALWDDIREPLNADLGAVSPTDRAAIIEAFDHHGKTLRVNGVVNTIAGAFQQVPPRNGAAPPAEDAQLPPHAEDGQPQLGEHASEPAPAVVGPVEGAAAEAPVAAPPEPAAVSKPVPEATPVPTGEQQELEHVGGEPTLPKNVTMDVDKMADMAAIQKVLGGVKPDVLGAMCCAQDGARMLVNTTGNGHVLVSVSEDGYTAERKFKRTRAGLRVTNVGFFIEQKKDDGSPNPLRGQGANIFANQVRALQQAGVTSMDTVAIGDKHSADAGKNNGYYTWPRLGYSGTIRPEVFRNLPESLRKQMGQSRQVRKLFSLDGGAEAWKEHGEDINCTFDLRKGSPNLQALNDYLQERKAKENGAATKPEGAGTLPSAGSDIGHGGGGAGTALPSGAPGQSPVSGNGTSGNNQPGGVEAAPSNAPPELLSQAAPLLAGAVPAEQAPAAPEPASAPPAPPAPAGEQPAAPAPAAPTSEQPAPPAARTMPAQAREEFLRDVIEVMHGRESPGFHPDQAEVHAEAVRRLQGAQGGKAKRQAISQAEQDWQSSKAEAQADLSRPAASTQSPPPQAPSKPASPKPSSPAPHVPGPGRVAPDRPGARQDTRLGVSRQPDGSPSPVPPSIYSTGPVTAPDANAPKGPEAPAPKPAEPSPATASPATVAPSPAAPSAPSEKRIADLEADYKAKAEAHRVLAHHRGNAMTIEHAKQEAQSAKQALDAAKAQLGPQQPATPPAKPPDAPPATSAEAPPAAGQGGGEKPLSMRERLRQSRERLAAGAAPPAAGQAEPAPGASFGSDDEATVERRHTQSEEAGKKAQEEAQAKETAAVEAHNAKVAAAQKAEDEKVAGEAKAKKASKGRVEHKTEADRDKLVKDNLKMADKFASKKARKGTPEWDDAHQEAALALHEAANKYDPNNKAGKDGSTVPFEGYAGQLMKLHGNRAAAATENKVARVAPVPRQRAAEYRALEKEGHSHEEIVRQMAAKYKWKKEELPKSVQAALRLKGGGQEAQGDDSGTSLADKVVARPEGPGAEGTEQGGAPATADPHEEVRALLHSRAHRLSPEEQQIIRWRHPEPGEKPKSYKKIAEAMGGASKHQQTGKNAYLAAMAKLQAKSAAAQKKGWATSSWSYDPITKAWLRDPGPRTSDRWYNTDTGKIVYAKVPPGSEQAGAGAAPAGAGGAAAPAAPGAGGAAAPAVAGTTGQQGSAVGGSAGAQAVQLLTDVWAGLRAEQRLLNSGAQADSLPEGYAQRADVLRQQGQALHHRILDEARWKLGGNDGIDAIQAHQDGQLQELLAGFLDGKGGAGENTKQRESSVVKYIRHEHGEWAVFSEAGACLGRHATKEEAEAQLNAIHANQHAKEHVVKSVTVDVAEVLAKVGEELRQHTDPAPMPGYGQIFSNEGDVWYVGGDGDEDGFHKVVEAKIREAYPGVNKIVIEAESFPPKSEGWKQVYPPEKAKA